MSFRRAFKLAVMIALASACAASPSWSSCCGPTDTLCSLWANVSFSPRNPQAGDTLVVNASGIMGNGRVLAQPPEATGAVDAYHGGSDVFEAPIATCGETSFSVFGIANVVIDALACPTVTGGPVSLGIVFPIPALARGLGAINVTVNASDNSGARIAFCLDVVVTV
jgi:hypothetical protein